MITDISNVNQGGDKRTQNFMRYAGLHFANTGAGSQESLGQVKKKFVFTIEQNEYHSYV